MRLGLPRPSGMVSITSSVPVSTTDTESDLVLVISSVRAAAGVAAATIRATASARPSFTRGSSSPGGDLLDSNEGQVRGRSPQGKSYRVPDLDRFVYLRRRRAKSHRHRRHVA